MTMVKHTQRMRKGCDKCGQPAWWFHDTSRSGYKRRCVNGSEACKAHGLDGQFVSWVLCDADGTRHVCSVTPTPKPFDYCQFCKDYGHTAAMCPTRREETPKPVAETPKAPARDASGTVDESAVKDLLAILSRLGGTVNPDQVREIVKQEMANLILPTRVEIKSPDGTVKPIEGAVHRVLPEVLTMLQAGENVWLTGPAGTGKSTIAHQCADALGVPFDSISLTVTTPVSEIVGYRDANGTYQDSAFYRVYALCDECGPDDCRHGLNGGLFLFDEMDNGSPNTVGKGNEAMANGSMSFPHKRVARHPRSYIVAAANTFGTGPDRQYVGRCQLDAATLDRFATVTVPIDEALETQVAHAQGADRDQVDALLYKVRRLRAKAEELRMNVVISPRASIFGAKLLAQGVSMDRVTDVRIRKGISDQDWARLNS